MQSKAFLLVLMFCLSTSTGFFFDSSHESNLSFVDEILSSDSKSSTDTSSWVISPSNGWTTGGEEITITGTGFLNMAYKNVTSDGEAYTWTTTTANYVYYSGWDPSIGVDSNGTVHIVYSNMDSDDFWHSSYDGSTWAHTKIRDCDSCRKADLVIDSNDNIHIAYYHSISGTGYLLYSMYDGTSWTNNWSKSGVENDQISLALDANDQPHISYSRDGYICNAALLSYYDGSSWSTVTLDDTTTYIGCDSSIAIDSNGFVHVAYRHHGNMDMKIASNISGSWQRYTVDNGASSVGYHSAMAVDSNDELHLVYASNSAGNTAYFADGASGSAWTVSNQGTSRDTFSMYIDQFDIVHISEYNGDSNLGYSMVAPGSSRQSMTIDSVGNVGYGNDIVVDDNNMVHMAYYDTTNKNLKYANRSTGMYLNQEITVQFGSYGSVTGTVVNDTTIRVTTPSAGSVAEQVDLKLFGDQGSSLDLGLAFQYVSPDDVDMDGVLNDQDDCPNQAGTSTVDLTGCPDTDGDGYSDAGDAFPNNAGEWMDSDGDGCLTLDEFARGLARMNIHPNPEDLRAIAARFDADGDGKIRFDEFVARVLPEHEVPGYREGNWQSIAHHDPKPANILPTNRALYAVDFENLLQQKIMSKADKMGSARRVFRDLDYDRSGFVSPGEFRRWLSAMNFFPDEDAFQKLWRRYDPEGKGVVDYDHFVRRVTPRHDPTKSVF